MNGYVKIKASEIPFYISLAQDGIKKYEFIGKHYKFKWNKTATWLVDENDYYNIKKKEEYYYNLVYTLSKIKDMLVKAKDRDIYIDVDSFDLLEKENN